MTFKQRLKGGRGESHAWGKKTVADRGNNSMCKNPKAGLACAKNSKGTSAAGTE